MRIAIIGVGGIGKTHVENIRRMPGVTITDICDVNPEAQMIADGLQAAYFADYRRMVEHTQAEAVLICTPTFLHAQQVRCVLEAGKHCICEKPLCLGSKDAWELFAFAEKKGVLLLAAHVLFFWEEYALLARIVREQTYGPALDASFLRLNERPAWISDGWLFDKTKSGSLAFDLHIHDLYYLVGLFGKPEIDALQMRKGAHTGWDEYLRVCYSFPGLTACAEASWYNAPIPFAQRYRVYFERGLVEYDGNRVVIYGPDQGPQVFEGSKEAAIGTHVNVPPTTAYLREMEHFFDCIKRGVPSEIVPPAQVIETIEVLETIAARCEGRG